MLDKIAVVFVLAGIITLLGFILYVYKYMTNKEYREKTNEKRKLSIEIKEIFTKVNYSYEENNYNKLLDIELGQSLSESILNLNKSKKFIEKDNLLEGNIMELTSLINIAFSKINQNDIEKVLSKFHSENVLFIKSKLSDIQKFNDEYFTKYNYSDIKNCFVSVLFGKRIIELIQKEAEKVSNNSKLEFQKYNLELHSIDSEFIKRILSDENFSKSINSLLKLKSNSSSKFISYRLWINLYQKTLNEKTQKLNDYFEYWNLDNLK